MLIKDRRRAERRWRSHHKFYRRLRSDWNDHGWRRDPPGRYGTRNIDGTSLCDCFFPWSEQAVRFKDTPTGRFRKRDERDDERFRYLDERRLHVDRESHGTPKPPSAERRRWKVSCFGCGFLLGFVWASPRERSERTKVKFGGFFAKCRNCARKDARVG